MSDKIKLQPQALDIERSILGAALVDANCLPELISQLFEEAFYVDSHKLIFKTIAYLYNNNLSVDSLTIFEYLTKKKQIETVGGIHYILKLSKDITTTAYFDTHCKILLEKYVKRDIIRASIHLNNDAYSESTDPFEVLEKAEKTFTTIGERVIGNSIKDIIHFTKDVYQQYKSVRETGVLGINTHILKYDAILCGLVSPDLTIIAARPGQGKTAFALSLTKNICIDNNIPCAWFSLEMDGTQLTRRLASMDSGISHEYIRGGKLADYEEERLFTSLDIIAKAPLFIEDKANIKIQDIKARATILKRKHNIQFIVVDYLQLMSGDNPTNREQEISKISRGLKTLAKDLKMPIIALSQLSRECEKRPDKMPQLSDLRESGAIEQDADCVIFLMRPEYYNLLNEVTIGGKSYDPKGLCIGKVGKNRHGECLSFAMNFNGPTMFLSNHYLDEDKPF